ncbi:MAG: acyl-CoA thioesterase II [Ruaniaceae bacterium]|nr:acyl-CoA thioesterase II [Ruaniaceae bacterium]
MSENTVRRHHPPLDHVMAVLNLRQSSPETFEGYSLPDISGRIYGGQVMAQALIAAGATVPESGVDARAVHSFHCYFLRPGKLHEPVTFHVERLHDGRSFSTRRTHAIQHDKPILSMILSFQKEQEGFDHYARMPNVPAPSELKSANDVYSQLDDELASQMLRTGAFDFRHVQSHLLLGSSPESQPRQAVWMRVNSPLPDRTSQLTHRALLAYACDQVMLEPVLRAHGLSWVTPGLKVASLDHSMWFHRPFDMRDWLLFVQSSPTAQGGRGLGEGLIFDAAGCLVASAAQEGMVRA